MILDIALRQASGDLPVGRIRETREGETFFAFDPAYVALGPARPVLSLTWYDTKGEANTLTRIRERADKIGRLGLLPPWFSGLLPEGALRQLVEDELGPGRHNEIVVLARLGSDLPGAVVASDPEGGVAQAAARPNRHGQRIRFSLAGVQMKFAANLAKDRVTFPAFGLGGDHIAKTSSAKVPILVEAEHVGMQLSRLLGIDVAVTQLVPKGQVDGVPGQYLEHGDHVLLSRRFDRIGTSRVHIEDFGQVAKTLGDQKYFFGTYETCMNFIARFSAARDDDLRQGFRRMVNDVLVGNSDAHLKNWSFVHAAEGPRLSPAYDIVPAGAWGATELALPLAGHKAMDNVNIGRLLRIGRYFGWSDAAVRNLVSEMVETAFDAWPKATVTTQAEDDVRRSLVSRLDRLLLVHEMRPAAFAHFGAAIPATRRSDPEVAPSTEEGEPAVAEDTPAGPGIP